MRHRKLVSVVLFCVLAAGSGLSRTFAQSGSSVKAWEEPLVIPTYRVGEPDRNPIFYNGRAYQGAQGPVYPYAFLDKLTDIRENHTYKAVYLENQYIKVCVLPELGGRILSAQDKTNGYDFFYHQHVVKPALIGMLGAWISGGVEWNIPHHHRATTFLPVDYTLEENADGSKTVWVGETEWRHRMKWIVGLTLYPDRSYLEATVKLFNRTPFTHSFLYFANVAVHANENYQVIFPPSTEYATFHGKTHFSRWPVSTSVFNGVDYTRGVEVSWWKNHPSPTSWFAWNSQEDFFGGYDHGKQAGVVHVADHHVVPGKKFWEFANGDVGRMWDKILTETDSPYIELMAGAYSDNQPDYSWIQPYEVKTWKQYWYPVREIGGFKNANVDAAVNLDVDSKGLAKLGVNTSAEQSGAKVLLTAGKRVVFEQQADISPAKPFTHQVSLPQGVSEFDLTLSVLDQAGNVLIAYSPRKPKGEPWPEPVKPPPAPKDIATVEELYLTGLRLEEFHSPALDPTLYWEEALRRDPGDTRVNTALGIRELKRGLFQKAEGRFETALRRLTKDYTHPRNGEALYYLGVAYMLQGKNDGAYQAFSKATWSEAWTSAAYFALAQIDCRRGDFSPALAHLDRSLSANALNTPALDLKAAILRRLGEFGDAAGLATLASALDPLDFWAGNELQLARDEAGLKDEAAQGLDTLAEKMRGDTQNYLELAVDYSHSGMWDEAIGLLKRLDELEPGQASLSPMVYYYLGYLNERKGNAEEAAQYYRLGSQAPSDYCFPFRLESIDVLEHATAHNPRDARARYYLGNLLYDRQPAEAIKAWEVARQIDSSFCTVHRNLGLAYARFQNDLPKALVSMEKAVACNPQDSRVLAELDQIEEQAGVPAEKRLARLERNQQVVLERDDAVQQEIALYVQLGQYEKAIDLLSRRHFHVWEGGGEIHDVFISAHLLRGQDAFRQQRFREALRDFQAALEYPENLEVGRPLEPPRDPEIHYMIGTAFEALGDGAQSRSQYEKAGAAKLEMPEAAYFQGLALRKLGQEDKAAGIFRDLLKTGEKELAATSDLDYFAKFGEKRSEAVRLAHARYLMGLGYLGQGKRAEAKAEFEKVLEKNANHLGALTQLAALR